MLKQLRVWAVSIMLLVAVPAAASAQTAQSGLIAQGFTSNNALPTGALVSRAENNARTVELSTNNSADRLVGVVSEQAFFEVSDANSNTQVVLEGTTPTLVSDLNGDIQAGDRITVSPIEGVGIKATQSSVIVGIAQSDLASVDTTTRTITDQSGQAYTVHIGIIPVQINVAAYITPEGGQQTGIPLALQNVANTIAGRSVSPLRIVLAATLTLLLFCVIVALLYSAVRSSLTAMGRNPLSANILHKGLTQIGLIVVGIAAAGFGIVYAILRI